VVAINRVLAVIAPLAVVTLAPTLARADDDGSATAAPGEVAPQPMPILAPHLLSATLLGDPEVDVEDDRRPPIGYTEVRRRRTGLPVGGAITFAASYGLSAFFAAGGQSGSSSYSAAMWIPIAGPFVEVATSRGSCEDVCGVQRAFLVGLGAAQVAGAVMTYFGATSTKRAWVRNDRVHDVVVSPTVGASGTTGLSLSGKW